MLYNLCLHLNNYSLTTAITGIVIFLLILQIKEKRDERKRA